MIVFVKYLVLLVGLYAAFVGIDKNNIAAGIVASGAFISYALIEVQDRKILNNEEIKEDAE
jgi:uncharacterized membrane protein YjfL (UPF0719 family)